jgi:hypothetical protein
VRNFYDIKLFTTLNPVFVFIVRENHVMSSYAGGAREGTWVVSIENSANASGSCCRAG